MKVKLDENALIPTKAYTWDAGWDLYAKEDFVVPPSETTGLENAWVLVGAAVHDTGVHIQIPAGYVGFIKSKSGLNVKYGITAEGVIDSGYTGSIVVKLYNHTDSPYIFKKGDKITQLVILPINTDTLELTDSLEETDRGDKGFGSSRR